MKERFRGILASQTAVSAAYILFGLVLLLRPGLSGRLICTLLGLGALLFGAVKLASYWRLKEMGGFQTDLFLGVIFAAVGIFTLVQPGIILSLLPIVRGIALMLGGLSKVQRAFQLKGMNYSRWTVVLGTGILTSLLGEGEYWLRPPYGILDEQARSWCGGPLILWSVDPEDWKDEDVDRVVAAVTEHVSDGDIILMHDLFPSSVDAALRVVDALLGKGYCFATVEQLLAQRGVAPEAGASYRRAAKN